MSVANDNPCLRLGVVTPLVIVVKRRKCPKPSGFCSITEIISRNFESLEIEPKKISGCVLRHANRVNYASMEGFIDKFLNQIRDDMRFFTGEESVF